MKATVVASLALIVTSMCSSAVADSFGTGLNQFEMEFVEIGAPGNSADVGGNPDEAGAVGYVYRLAKFEVSRAIVETANREGELGLTLHDMEFVRGGPRLDMPATGVSWYEAARFVNWLNTSEGFSPAYKFTDQPGDPNYESANEIQLWADGDPGFDATNPLRNSRARYFLPTADEWYKAAYYDPYANDGAGGYWDFPTGQNEVSGDDTTLPTPVAAGTDPNTAVYSQEVAQGPADITQAGGLSPFGVMGLAGNVLEWDESEYNIDFCCDAELLVAAASDNAELLAASSATGTDRRGYRGGDWVDSAGGVSRHIRYSDHASYSDYQLGFRVVSIAVPEPNTLLLFLSACLTLHPRCRRLGSVVDADKLRCTTNRKQGISMLRQDEDGTHFFPLNKATSQSQFQFIRIPTTP